MTSTWSTCELTLARPLPAKALIALFEPLVVRAVRLYKASHLLELQQALLTMFGRLIRFGVDFT